MSFMFGVFFFLSNFFIGGETTWDLWLCNGLEVMGRYLLLLFFIAYVELFCDMCGALSFLRLFCCVGFDPFYTLFQFSLFESCIDFLQVRSILKIKTYEEIWPKKKKTYEEYVFFFLFDNCDTQIVLACIS